MSKLLILDGISRCGKTSFIARNKEALGITHVVHPYDATGGIGQSLRLMYTLRENDRFLTNPLFLHASIGCHMQTLAYVHTLLDSGHNVALDRSLITALVYNCEGTPKDHIMSTFEYYCTQLRLLNEEHSIVHLHLQTLSPRTEYICDPEWKVRNSNFTLYQTYYGDEGIKVDYIEASHSIEVVDSIVPNIERALS